jgi:hypothetical protein
VTPGFAAHFSVHNEASAQDGVLQVLVPKAEEAQAKHITVRADQPHAAVISGTAANNGS